MPRRVAETLAAGALLGLALLPSGQAAEPITLRYGQNAAASAGLSALPVIVAQRKGFFARQGLDIVVVPIAGGTDRIVAALDAGDIDAGRTATPYLIQAVLKGSDAVAIATETANPIYSLIAKPEIKGFDQLKGKTIGLSTPGDTITLATRRLLAAKGVLPSDVKVKTIVGTGPRFDCLESADCAAVPMGQPEDIKAVQAGFPRLGFTYEAGADLLFNVDMVRRAWGEKNKAAVVRYVRALASSYEFIRNRKNRSEVIKIIGDSQRVSADVAREIFAPYLQPEKNVLPKRGELDLQAFDRVLALMAEAGVIPAPAPPAAKFVDLQYLQAAKIQ
jgi:ABC-type nitrate/sulfonate/bicarbonate transport system substrate-binding protein